jgi:hypothetical protein
MARQSVSDGLPMFRVIITRLPQVKNPNWQRGVLDPDNPMYLYDGEPFETAYGPYNSLGTARAQVTHHTLDGFGEARRGVVDGRVQKATTTWEDVS